MLSTQWVSHDATSSCLTATHRTQSGCGLALYLAGHLLFRRLTGSGWATPRAVTAVTLLALLPIAASVAALAALLLALLTLASLVTYETLHDAEQRRALRRHDSPLPSQPTG